MINLAGAGPIIANARATEIVGGPDAALANPLAPTAVEVTSASKRRKLATDLKAAEGKVTDQEFADIAIREHSILQNAVAAVAAPAPPAWFAGALAAGLATALAPVTARLDNISIKTRNQRLLNTVGGAPPVLEFPVKENDGFGGQWPINGLTAAIGPANTQILFAIMGPAVAPPAVGTAWPNPLDAAGNSIINFNRDADLSVPLMRVIHRWYNNTMGFVQGATNGANTASTRNWFAGL